MKDKAILKAVFVTNLLEGKATVGRLLRALGFPGPEVRLRLEELERTGSLRKNGGTYALTPKGRRAIKVVFIGGTFEVIHAGHYYTIEQARKRGDLLVAVVARDSTVRKRKGRDPFTPEEERRKVLASIRQVDIAILGSETNIYDTLEKVKPDVVALGYDQYHAEEDVLREAKKRGMHVSVARLDSPVPDLKTSRLLAET